MRVLTVGIALPNVDVDNYNALTAPSYFDYDVVYVDPATITTVARQMIEGEKPFESFDGRPIINGATSASGLSAADQFKRRAEETQRLLEAGGVVVVAGRPNATQPGIIGFEGLDRYSWLPAPGGIAWGPPFIRQAEGRTVRVTMDEHPLGDIIREYRPDVAYRATFDERQPEVRRLGRVLATGGLGGMPVAMEFPVTGGTVIFVPAFKESSGPGRMKFASAMVDAFKRLVGANIDDSAPSWTRSLALPGLEQLEAEVADAESAAKDAEERLTQARSREREIASYRRLLWQEGPPFEDAVSRALKRLGFEVTSEAGSPLEVTTDGRVAFVEAASAREQIVEWPYVHMQRRLEQHLLETKEQRAGLIVVNGKRHEAPESRKEPLSEALRVACENYRYCLVTGETLFAMVQRALAGADDAALSGMRRRLMATAGLLEKDVALGDVEEEKDAGPIF